MTVVVVGPGTVHGPRPVPGELAAAACAAIDDGQTVVEDRVVDVDALWRTVLGAATGGAAPLVLICPGWWRPARIDRVRRTAGAEHVLRQRHTCYPAADGSVEITEDFVLVRLGGHPVPAIPRLGPAAQIADEVDRLLTVSGPVVIDAAVAVSGAADLAAAIAARTRARGRDATIVDDHVLLRSVPAPRRARPPQRRRVGLALAAGALLATGALLPTGRGSPESSSPTLITEGRVAVQVPADWTVAKVLDGPGSARLQVISPEHRQAAILLTQSPAGPEPAAVLAAALAGQPPGVFVDFRAEDHRAGRNVMSYREIRPGRNIDWAVFVDGGVRIAVGCQQPGDRPDIIRAECDEAIRSARAAV
ncbi:type VII secretion-associated protein [Mycobacterium sp. C31M]